ncbi:UDP-N-acetylmuramoylalanyl-D-glutamate--2,6-diaminopimelate ligase [Francisella persica ATCC VR-331]|uniref:UDP-N-acetylmuramyl-tripeptide synthetase n=1 Tax=Francisella persica ATCC VR-331 TaxID=1086726 RepID=A0AAC8VDA9_9GAMM|nr:UDP-N-acetylmuramoyl-L-alanyl-D-glutamate--2,6-diaminopimelate ligase [Francisella persica]ALB01469.1 UDP-N-acetylmuramoylalanyl-D-glutamate--2,6-diaminopimelate ligase [Francisella persica ATCC VR-331]ANH77759.1 UDP-N-acetylmuramoylalanyl-D-glutamate--2,6-diaminopimelate ligase [Francisella persica ATCC VR-331]
MKNQNQILEFLGIKALDDKNILIQSLYLDSRKCDDKSVFIALKGQITDGNKYIANVLAKGVRLVLSDNPKLANGENIFFVDNLKDRLSELAKWFYDYRKPQNIIGITGTNGKTSISNYIAQFLDLSSQKTLLLGTNGNGIYPVLKESTHTTLDVLSLYEVIFRFNSSDKVIPCLASQSTPSYFSNLSDHEGELRNLVMEVSSHSLDQKRVAGLDFDIAVFSNLSHDHLDYHKTMDNYFEAKAKLFKFKSLKKAVINIDDEYGQKFCEICYCDVITVSLKSKNADVYISVKNIHNMQISFDLYISQKHIGTYQTSLVGEFNLMNLGLSLGALYSYIAREQLLASIASIKPVKGRIEVIELDNSTKVIIDYAHTPGALEKVLQTLKQYSKSNLWCIFGCGGDRDVTKRPKMAQIAERYANKIVVTEDNNRFENIENIFSDIKKGFNNPENHIFITSREKAIKYSIENTSQGDIILLAGKGHECYLDKNGVKEHFDERDIVTKYKFQFKC